MRELIGSGMGWVAKNIIGIVVMLAFAALFATAVSAAPLVGTVNSQGIWIEVGMVADMPTGVSMVCRLDEGFPEEKDAVNLLCVLADWDNALPIIGNPDGTLEPRNLSQL